MKRRRGYLKHYNDATMGETIQRCLYKKEPYAVILFWFINELCNQKNTPNGIIEIQDLSKKIHVRTDKLLKTISRTSELIPELKLTLIGNHLEFISSNYMKYNETRGKKSTKSDIKSDVKNGPIKDKRLKIKDKRLNIYKNAHEFDFGLVLNLFKTLVVKSKGPKAEKRFRDQIKTQENYDNLTLAIKNYAAHLKLPENSWKTPKQSFETFLGTDSSGYYWEEFIDESAGKVQIPKAEAEESFSEYMKKQQGVKAIGL